jgi:cellulose synthase/poly-beta-1,6-N-acetylglucosamine synthase-like glycosyltransferase
MSVQEYIIIGIEYLIFGYFAMSGLYIFIFSVAGNFYKKRLTPIIKDQNKIAVFIPGYKEDAVIVEVAKSALKQNYPSNQFDVIVIADSFKVNTIKELKALPINLIEVSFEKSTKSKALNKAMESLNVNYNYALILDADNIMEPDFLQKINDAFNSGYQIVQGHRKAKNYNTSYAILDAASEEINNHIFRKGHRVLGLSSGLIGSGMAFDYNLFKSMMSTVNAIGGFDKELEFKFAKKRIAIEYLQDAIVLDEKVQKSSDFSNQRKRWLSTQFVYLKKYFKTGWKELLFKGNINFFNKVWQLIIPPRILLLGITFLLSVIYCLLSFGLNTTTHISVYGWLLNLIITVSAFILAIPKSFYNTNTLKALLSLPSAFFRMTLLLFKLKGANKKFIHTTHGAIETEKL